ncbi:beta-galactosidase GalB [Olivibacter sitiensis]|uniref:beta-galactosidase GalB n=1 Tax=Olivibacter sitiensis TaxID=376470 RepID=UPI00055CC0CD|nr:beta-galactosidase GalB [Olivibacter sitiensis]
MMIRLNQKYISTGFRLLVCLSMAAPLLSIFTEVRAQSERYDDRPIKRERILINENWKFYKYSSAEQADSLIYDVRPEVEEDVDGKPADARPTEAIELIATRTVLKPWILPTGNNFIEDSVQWHVRPEGHPGSDFPFVERDFDDSSWKSVNLPHDWAINGPFYEGWNTEIGGGMGRLPIQGVAWYRKELDIPETDAGKSIFLEMEGAMSYAMVWLNGKLVGGWPYGYASWQLDLTPYVIPGTVNQLAIRLDNPPSSSRWYPGGGIYRNVWLTKTAPVHVAQWGAFVQTHHVSKSSATVELQVTVDNRSAANGHVSVATEIYLLDANGRKAGSPVAQINPASDSVAAYASASFNRAVSISNPKLWGPPPNQVPDRYVAVIQVSFNGRVVDTYETVFGIRDLHFDPDKGLLVNGERILMKGVNQHHDLGALGAAFNRRAAERQLELLREMGCNAIRMAHNPPAPGLLELTDSMGFLVIDEIFDNWELKKTPLDFHLIFPDWHEQDLRALVRRDRNHPSVILWSFGNEVGEQYTDEKGAELARRLQTIVKAEDATRPTTVSMNYAKPHMPLPAVVDIISLNYQGEGIRNGPAYSGLKGINTPPLFPAFRERFPDKMILSSENAAAVSSRGEYLFPVFDGNSAPVKDGQGGDPDTQQVSAYELYSVEFGAAPDKVFATMDAHPYVAGGFVWSGWDYLGEPTPYYLSRSSYFGIIDLAGFKKDRFYLYQAYWRPDMPMAHILPHWNWQERVGQVTPVHVFTSGDEVELFLNGVSLGRKKRGKQEYRLRWDDIKYAPGELKAVAFKDGKRWAEDIVKTTGAASQLMLQADRPVFLADGEDLVFVTVSIADKDRLTVPRAKNLLRFSIDGPGEIVATDNGDPTSLVSFSSLEREAFNGLCLVIVRARRGQEGAIKLTAESAGLDSATILLKSIREE